jgi:hypothetical protein
VVALPVCVPCRLLKAPPAGFEPAISCVTGRRALQAAPRGLYVSVAQAGLEPAASLVLSQGGLPLPTEPASNDECGMMDDELQEAFILHHSPFIISQSGPGWSRTIVSWVWTKRRCRWTTGPLSVSGVMGSRTPISSMPCWRLPVGP